MNKDGLLRSIAETGYNVGFGAKKHFATYDIVDKVPGWIGGVSLAIGIISLVFEPLSTKEVSALLTVAGVVGLYINFYDHDKARYETVAKDMTVLFLKLRDLYRGVQSGEVETAAGFASLKDIEKSFYGMAISKQVAFSDWFAHYKFFAQFQVDWLDEQKSFTWRDKVPLSFRIVVGVGSILLLLLAVSLLWSSMG